MFKFRNRNIGNFNFDSSTNLPIIDQDINPCISKNVSPIACFGECIPTLQDSNSKNKRFSRNICSSNDSDIFNIISDGNESNGKSYSSSSLSWAEEFEDGVTKNVQEQLNQMDNVLQGLEPIPPNYDRDEFELWMNTFSPLELMGKQEKHTIKTRHNIHKHQLSSFPDQNLFKKAPKEVFSDKHSNTVISDVIGSGLFFSEQRDSTIKRKQSKSKNNKIASEGNAVKTMNARESTFESVLKISKAPVRDNSSRYLEIRRSSNISKSQALAKNCCRGMSPEYTSMPHLSVEQYTPRNERNFSATSQKKNHKPENFRKLSNSKSTNYKLTGNNSLTLPPIKQYNSSSSQYRSISATPRNQSKSSSALSVKSVVGTKMYRIEIRSGLETNELSHRNVTNISFIPKLHKSDLRRSKFQ